MTILITGASGLIGSHLCAELAKTEQGIIALSRSTSPLLKETLECYPANITYASCDLSNKRATENIILEQKPETIFHIAACCQPYHIATNFIESNIIGTANLLDTLTRAKTVKNLIYASTMSIYTTPPRYLPVDESHPAEPSSIYGKTKLAGEYMCNCLPDTRVAILRFASVFGVGDTARVAGLFMTAALSGKPLIVQGDGSQSSDFIYVDDAIQGILKTWKKNASGVYNIGSGQEITIGNFALEVIRATCSASKVKMVGVAPKPFRFVSNISKARTELGYQPGLLSEGLKKYMEALRAQR